jgi:Arc/MetJ-type ribon-helix-helix transcriptional regulator
MTRYEKIAISLPSHAAENARRAVKRGEAASVSAYITSAIEAKAKVQSREEFLADLVSESGPPTLKQWNWARAMLGKPPVATLPGFARPKRRARAKR